MRRWLPSGRALLWTAIAIVAGPPLLIALVMVLAVALDLDVVVDLEMVLYALVATILATGLVLWLRQRMRPRQTVSVGYGYKLIQPRLPLGRYRFELEIYYEMERKGELHRVQQGSIEMLFKKGDHPELMAWCREQICAHLDQHADLARARFPEAEILLAPPPRPGTLEASRPALDEPRPS